MRVISEQELIILKKSFEGDDDRKKELRLLTTLIDSCKELNPWLPIGENTPKNKRLLVDFTCGLVFIARYDGKLWEIEEGSSDYYGQPIRYQELPDNQEPTKGGNHDTYTDKRKHRKLRKGNKKTVDTS